jgi:putative hydrolase of the HAD superfamily
MLLDRPKGLLLDYGGTLVEEVEFDPRAGNELLLARAAYRPQHISLEQVLERTTKISTELAARRDQFQLETPWPTQTRLIHDFFGTRFLEPMAELEMAFWKASVKTRPMPGARAALEEFHRCGVPIAVVSNCSFGQDVIRYELAKHGLAERLAFIMVSAEYAVRKPHPLIFETAAGKLGVKPKDIWFVGDQLQTDIAGARAAGMTTAWLSSAKSDPTNSADLTIANWSDLVDYFTQSRDKSPSGDR